MSKLLGLMTDAKVILAPLLTIALISVSACSRYFVSINENVVYEPTQVFTDYQIRDVALNDCVKSTIAEKKLTRAEQLKSLLCPEGEIVSIDGLGKFGAIEYLGLDNNKISKIESLAALKKLKQLSVKNNDIVNFSALWELKELGLIEASGNNAAICTSFDGIVASAKLVLPKHCQEK